MKHNENKKAILHVLHLYIMQEVAIIFIAIIKTVTGRLIIVCAASRFMAPTTESESFKQ